MRMRPPAPAHTGQDPGPIGPPAGREGADHTPPERAVQGGPKASAPGQVDLLDVSAAALCLLALLLAGLSLSWRMEHDTPLLHYAAWLVAERGRTPYVDLFETSMVGTFALHTLIGSLVGYGAQAFRWLDLAVLAGFAASLVYALRPTPGGGRRVAAAAAGLHGCLYLAQGPALSLQRDGVGALLVWAALVVAWRGAERAASPGPAGPLLRNPRARSGLVVGVLFGLAASIKPHLLLGLPVVWLALAGALGAQGVTSTRGDLGRRLGRSALGVGVGGAAVAGAAVAWLLGTGAWPHALRLFRDYMPLHLALTRYHVVLPDGERAAYLWEQWSQLGGYGALLPLAAVGVLRGWQGQGPRVRALGLLTLVYAVYPALSGQFWDYHWAPFALFLAVTAAHAWSRRPARETSGSARDTTVLADCGGIDCRRNQLAFLFLGGATSAPSHGKPWLPLPSRPTGVAAKTEKRRSLLGLAGTLRAAWFAVDVRVAPAVITVAVVAGLWQGPGLDAAVAQQLAGRPMDAPKQGRVDAMAAALRTHVRPGETVQPLDWTSGANHALLLTRTPLATSFLYNYHFYHHVDTPVIQGLRRRFMAELAAQRPALVIDIDGEEAPTGPGTARDFPALDAWLRRHYRPVTQGADWQLLRRVEGLPPTQGAPPGAG